MLRISLQNCPVVAPNCANTDTVSLSFQLTDRAGNTASVSVQGALAAVNEIIDANPLVLSGTDGSSTMTNASGVVNISETYNVGFQIDENVTITSSVTDCENWQSVDDLVGCTNAIMTQENMYIEDHEGNYIAFV